MEGVEFVFHYAHLLHYKRHKINPICSGSYMYSPDWIKNKNTRISPINKRNNECFQYAVKVALNEEEIRKNSERITKSKPFIDKQN